ncbi:MAG: DedA family protein [Bacteroidetes bacterium]|nr:DedA family protein [Bacteroidota bacterium]
MPTLESIVEWLRSLPPAGLYAAIFLTSYIENIFPPSPSDAILLFIATLIGIGTIGHVESILIATAGSTLGFMTAFILGRRYGRSWVASGRFPFLTQNSLAKVDGWFDKYGYGVIVANRFLAGTRAVISFFAGMSNLAMLRTTLLCTLSALAWNTILIELGAFLGKNWRDGEVILDRYGLVVSILLALVGIYFLVRWLIRRRKGTAEKI